MVNYLEETLKVMIETLGPDATGEEALRWLFECGIADEYRARTAIIKREFDAGGASIHAMSKEIGERHCMAAVTARSYAYKTSGPMFV